MKRILFSQKNDWVEPVRERLDGARFMWAFQNLHESDISAFDCIVPLYLTDYAALRGQESCANFLIPSRLAVDVANDKSRFNSWLDATGFKDFVPDFRLEKDVFPFIYKKRHDRAGRNSRVIFSMEEQEAFENAIDIAEYFKQRYVGGRTEYTTHFLVVNGEVKFHATVRFTFEDDFFIRGIREPRNEIDRVKTPHLAIFCEILEALGYSGTCCFNYKIEDARPLIFEINPRCGSSLRLDLNPYLDAYLGVLENRRPSRRPDAAASRRQIPACRSPAPDPAP